MAYLEWLRDVLDLPGRNCVTLTNVAREADGVLALTVVQDGAARTLLSAIWCWPRGATGWRQLCAAGHCRPAA
ncbi:hypothetical protein [Komagataeibacter nataicola]|uniref:hypothetical protein n=1 Tax=Komagataeibacter nataicola TaxID=265960 RepID=UPI00197B8343|nr:hypothetical protein [Komagataeibacter nataicola]